MKIITADGRKVSVGGGASLAGASTWSGAGSVSLTRALTGRRRSMRHAEVARTNPWVRAATDARASVGSRVPLHVFRPLDEAEGRGERDRVRTGDPGPGSRLPALLAHPAPDLSGRRWRRRILTDKLVHGNGLIEKVTSGGNLVELRWHPWCDVEWHLTDDGLEIEAFEVPTVRRKGLWLGPRWQPGETRMIDRADAVLVLDVEEVSIEEGPVGLSPIASLHATQALYDAAMRFAVTYMDKGVFPTGVVELSDKATPELAQATRELLEAVHSKVENAGRPLAVAGKWHQVMATPEGAKLIELAKWSREEVAGAYRIPLPVLGDLSSTNRSTAQVSREQFIRDVVGDDVAVLESELNAQLVAGNRRWAAAGIWVEGQLGELLRPDAVAMAEVLHKQVGGPVMTPNDGRKVINLPPLDDERADRLVLNPGTPEEDIPDEEDPDDEQDEDDL